MSLKEFVLKLSAEGREWFQLLAPILAAWHLPPPKYMTKVGNKEEG
jgi:hypothetical protein